MTKASQYFTPRFHNVGVPTCKVARVSDKERNFDDRDCCSYVKRFRTQLIDEGDAKGVLRYCQRIKRLDPDFFYSVTVDKGGLLENLFWVDSRSRVAYQQFGDVITFDTTYRTNKYQIPFALFVGLNHRMQSTFFGCAIMQDDTEESFVWVFNTFLEAMHEKIPGAVITNQNIAMGNALARVMPQSRHRLCYWHIKKEMPNKLSGLYRKGSTFKLEIKKCLKDSRSPKEFDTEWCRIICAYELEDNSWISSLYDVRNKWVPVYCRNTFFAGMTTTQRSESINAFFDKFIDSGTTLCEFIKQFQEGLNSHLEECRKEDFHAHHKECTLELRSPLERHASDVYTRKVFSIFRQELSQINEYKKVKVHVDGPKVTYRITRHMDQLDDAKDINVGYEEVVFDKHAKTAKCSCQEFEFRGILCRHILMVFTHKGVDKIPAEYVLPRWTKNGDRLLDSTLIPSNVRDVETLRLHHFFRATRMLQESVKVSHEAYKLVLSGLKDLYIQASKLAYAEDDTTYIR
ncbi:unnamed protein product [Cuscuta campestris]|uniref:Protein FAR1-RELATED SEQUENCE n=1 Tax=Cuscuta campestris TaxID=132261 RepID=A0A484MS29_9ASTE|nr:unnamed protein product [Cuscuta campestris]